MRFCTTFVSFLLVASVVWQNTEVPSPPATPKRPVVDGYHGVKVTDDYRWLEEGKSPDVIAWTAAQDKYARSLLDPLPLHTSIYEFMKRLDSERSPSYYDLQSRGSVLFAMNSQPGKQQDMLVTISSAGDPGSRHLVLDPTALDPTNSTTIQAFVPSPDGSKVALSLPSGGSMVSDIYIYDVATGRALPDVLTHVSGLTGASLAWNADGSGLYYTHYPHEGERAAEDLNFYEQVYFHKLGTRQSTDTYELGKDFPRIADIWLSESKDGKYVLAEVGNGDMGPFQLFLRGASGAWTQITKFSDEVRAATFGGDALYMVSRQNAPLGKILRLPLASPAFEKAKTIVPEGKAVIQDFTYTFGGPRPTFVATANLLYVTELLGGPSHIRIFDQNGKDLGTVPSEPVSAISQILPLENDRILFRNESYLNSPAWFYYEPNSGKTVLTALHESHRVGFADAETVRALCSSKDGTKVPLNIIQRKGTKLDGQNPVILTGYGGFGLSLTPMFDPEIRVWLDAGGVYVVANLRGGDEFGEEWHKNGSGIHKQNVFDDFIACAQYLIQAGYTKPAKLGIEGGSNGGLLMAAVATQRPELFGAVVSVAGLYDMLRSETTQSGQFFTTEFGSVKDPLEFRALYAYSPYHHVLDGTKYPPILFLTGDNDPAVDPANSRKMTARLQAANASGRPVLIVNFTNAGHGGIGSSEDQQAAIDSYLYEFMFDQLKVKWPSSGEGSR
jgi:prolyl oligopeptidase